MRYNKAQIILAKIKGMLNHGCGDGHCIIKRPSGMHTNGGCDCRRMLPDLMLEAASWMEREPLPYGKPCPIPESWEITDEDERAAFLSPNRTRSLANPQDSSSASAS